MQIAAITEQGVGETRVALVPKTITAFVKAGATVAVEGGAGKNAAITDTAFKEAGASITTRDDILKNADVVVCINCPPASDLEKLKDGAVLVGLLDPIANPDITDKLLSRKVTAFRMQALPRISRAQEMDVLSSQANIAGYAAAVLSAQKLPRLFPLMMTAAGTVTPAHALVLGAGVAGLQAIATCKRMGAVVEAFDVRPAVKEQVESLGAKFLEVDIADHAETEGGYAKELSADSAKREQEVIAQHAKDADVIITTAFIPNQPAPLLITAETVATMKPGSVIIDLAAPSGGNCAVTKPGEEVTVNGVLVYGPTNLPALFPAQASQLFAHNISRFLLPLIKEGQLSLDWDDEVVAKSCFTHAGERKDQPAPVAAGASS